MFSNISKNKMIISQMDNKIIHFIGMITLSLASSSARKNAIPFSGNKDSLCESNSSFKKIFSGN